MDNAKINDTPIVTATRLDMDELGIRIDEKKFRGRIGSLLYLTVSRPDIVYNMGLCASFRSIPGDLHFKATKRILRNLKGTLDLVLWYPTGDSFKLIGYADADYAGYLVDMKSTSGMAHFLGLCLISWASKK
ncbi:PREDICTED: uncharacterized protein LOC109232715 [Nicotiana attenuata]|uniref:uncharacterized protein LOC109232715 n=1 Tax=Nicotiana attenuata TaxID=49451 RepID=UPI0009053716|nr:PREDICTED: uncharacterized protein LOC109232715 [Nicotiana attenuata]